MSNQKDFSRLKTNIGNEVGNTSSSFATRIGVYINNRYFDILNRLAQAEAFELYRSMTATTTASTSDYIVPNDFGWPVHVIDRSNSRTLDVVTEMEWSQRYGTIPATTGAPIVLIMKSESNIRVQPASSTQIKIVSDSSSDSTYTTGIRGISGSAEYYETVTASANASAGSSNNYDFLVALTKSGTTTGKITFSYVTGGQTASIINPAETESRYKRIGFYYVPAGSYDIEIRYKRDLAPLSGDDDVPVIDIADGIELGAKSDAWRTSRQFAKAADFETLYERWLDRYINNRITNLVHQFDVRPYSRLTGDYV